MTSDVEENCSVCLKTGTVFNIFTTYNISNDKEELYVELIKKCYNIEITEDSGLETLCTNCILKLGTEDFKNDIIEAAEKLVRDAEESQDDLDDNFEDGYDLNTVLNPETGQISYTLDKINDGTKMGNEPDTYLIDLENITTGKEEGPKRYTKKRRKNTDVVKENIPGNIESETKVGKKRVQDVKKKVPVLIDDIPDIETEGKKSKKARVVRKSPVENVGKEAEDISVQIGENQIMKFKPIKPSKANMPPPFTLDPGQLDCKECGKRFDTTKTLSTHMNAHYPDYVCAECGQVFASQRRMRMHKSQAHVEGPLTCKYCDKEFTNVNTRNAHMWRVHTKTDSFKCSQCDQRFKTYLKRLRHVQQVHGNAAEYPCQYCDKKFAYAAYRTKHVRTKHLDVRPYKCPSCPYSFARRRELDSHRASKHGDGDLKYQCDICSRRFFLKTALKFHLKLHVNRVNLDDSNDTDLKIYHTLQSVPITMDENDVTFTHLQNNAVKYSCNQCDAKFQKIRQLETHRKVHETEPPLTPLLDPGSLHLDPGSLHLDPGSLHLDPGSLHLDPGSLHLDPGSLNLDAGPLQLDSGSIHLDPDSLHLDPGTLHLDEFADYSLADVTIAETRENIKYPASGTAFP